MCYKIEGLSMSQNRGLSPLIPYLCLTSYACTVIPVRIIPDLPHFPWFQPLYTHLRIIYPFNVKVSQIEHKWALRGYVDCRPLWGTLPALYAPVRIALPKCHNSAIIEAIYACTNALNANVSFAFDTFGLQFLEGNTLEHQESLDFKLFGGVIRLLDGGCCREQVGWYGYPPPPV